MESFALFATPIYVYELPELDETNREIRERLLAERAAHPAGVQRSNVGGWHSAPDLGQRQEPCYRALLQALVGCVDETVARLGHAAGAPPQRWRYGLHGWAMVLDPGDYVMAHDHGDAHWSTAYYVDAGDETPDPGGYLAFLDPRRGGRPLPGLDHSTFSVRPRTGTLVVFPGWLQHYVHAYRGQRPRISISCNVLMEPSR
jgi:hypothetical protein